MTIKKKSYWVTVQKTTIERAEIEVFANDEDSLTDDIESGLLSVDYGSYPTSEIIEVIEIEETEEAERGL